MTTTWLDAPICTTHSWKWVPTWANLGFDECWRCGFTTAVREGWSRPVSAPEATADTGGRRILPVLAAEPPKMGRPPLPPVTVEPVPEFVAAKGLRGEAAAVRDMQILVALNRGDRAVVVAKQFGISLARVYQIKDAAKRREAGS